MDSSATSSPTSHSVNSIIELCELNEDADSIVKGQRMGTFSISISAGSVSLQGNSLSLRLKLGQYQCHPLTRRILAFHPEQPENGHSLKSYGICFETQKERDSIYSFLRLLDSSTAKTSELEPSRKRKCLEVNNSVDKSDFDFRTEEASAAQYFQFYGSLFQQQNMMQDFTRTATYQRAIHENHEEFRGKVVLDVGAGSGILSFFAAQAGAKRIYAVEASSMADHCRALVSANSLGEVIKVVTGKIEEIELPECVDIIISEPMGYMLVNERMLESYVYARKFLKTGGTMYPSRANLHVALFSDEQLYLEQISRCSFWSQESFHGVNLSALKQSAVDEIFHQPVVDAWHVGILASKTVTWSFDFERDNGDSLRRIEIPFEFCALKSGYIHGIATWFDVEFAGKNKTVWLSTAPTEPLTHWYQVRCLLKTPFLVMAGQEVSGRLFMTANDKQSYELDLELCVDGRKERNILDLKMPYFRYTGQPVLPPPGHSAENPTELLLSQNFPVKQLCDLLTASPAVTFNGHSTSLGGGGREQQQMNE